jgi:hypothetical protein
MTPSAEVRGITRRTLALLLGGAAMVPAQQEDVNVQARERRSDQSKQIRGAAVAMDVEPAFRFEP